MFTQPVTQKPSLLHRVNWIRVVSLPPMIIFCAGIWTTVLHFAGLH
jgi:hypothetical protein